LPPPRRRADRIAAAAERLVLENRRGDFNAAGVLIPAQLRVYEDKSQQRACLTTRRSGKSYLGAFELLETALDNPGSFSAYVTNTLVDAKRLIKGVIEEISESYGLDAQWNGTEHSFTLPNRSKIYLLGVEDEGAIERFRGLALLLLVIDEIQSMPWVRPLLATVLPSLMKRGTKGRVLVLGTPSILPVGWWYEVWHGETGEGWSKHEWTLYDNTTLGTREEIDAFLRLQAPLFGGWDSPQFQREYFKKWTADLSRLVFSPYDPDANDFAATPAGEMFVVLGVDLASFPDKTAIVAEGWSPTDGGIYHLDETQWHPPNIDDVTAHLLPFIERWRPVAIVMDEGGLGKMIGDSIRTRPPYINVEPAEKHRKLEFIQFANADLASRRIRVHRGTDLANDLGLVQWDLKAREKGKIEIAKKPHSDIVDAWLYAVRKLQSLYHFEAARRLTDDEAFAAWRAQRIEEKNRTAADEFAVEDAQWQDE
jgi:hypothetical protein